MQEEIDKKNGTKTKFIRAVGNNPFFVYSFSYDQLVYVRDMLKKHGLLGLYFDATGRMAQQPKDVNKKTLYYSGTIPFKIQDCDQATIVPAFDALMAEHNISAMKNLLTCYKDRLIEVTHKWPVYKFVVSDGNFASLHAICEVFNNMDLISYINLIFDKVTSENQTFDEITQLKSCCSHLMHNIAILVSESYETADKTVIYNVKCMMAAMFDQNWTEIQSHWRNVHVLFNSKFENPSTKKAFSEMQKSFKKGSDISIDLTEIEETLEALNVKKYLTLYERSRFYIALRQIQMDVNSGKVNRQIHITTLYLKKNF